MPSNCMLPAFRGIVHIEIHWQGIGFDEFLNLIAGQSPVAQGQLKGRDRFVFFKSLEQITFLPSTWLFIGLMHSVQGPQSDGVATIHALLQSESPSQCKAHHGYHATSHAIER